MILVVASRLDREATSLVEAWRAADARLVSAEDLSRPGWVFQVDAPARTVLVAEGRRVPVSQVSGVLVRRPAVLAAELLDLAAQDRAYAAAEMGAFLVALLAAAPCLVIDRPTPSCLSGPGHDPLRWALAVGRAGLRSALCEPLSGPLHEVVVCKDRCFGHKTPAEAEAMAHLAASSRLHLLGAHFTDTGAIAAVSPFPRLAVPALRAALLDDLGGGR